MNAAQVLKQAKTAIRNNGFTDIGCYPLFAIMADSEPMCIDAIKKNWKLVCRNTISGYNKDWKISAIDINYENEYLFCSDTNIQIHSAYGDS